MTPLTRIKLCLFSSSPDIHARGFLTHVLTGDPQDLAARSLELGYDGFEYLPNPENVPNPNEFRRALDRTGAVLPVVNTGRMVRQGLTLFHPDPVVAGRAKEAFGRILEFAGAVGAQVGLGIARGPARPDLDPPSMDQLAEEVFVGLAERASAAGTVILLEPAETNVTRFILGVDEVMAWVDRVANPAFQIMLDTHQLVELEPSIEHGIRAARGRATHIHLFDPERTPPGTHPASLDWKQIFSLLHEERFQGSASAPLPRPEQPATPQSVAAFLRERMHAASAR
jgi:D-psicose/D-tagatose/L-ribulose 3-epimerase